MVKINYMFKNISLPYFFLLSLFFLFSCEKGEETIYHAPSSGPIHLISVFSSDEIYTELEPAISDSLIFGKIFPGLYYPPEIMFATRHFESDDFNRFKTTRLILDIHEGQSAIEFKENEYAKPQAYVKVSGENPEEIKNTLIQYQDSLINFYRAADRKFLLNGFSSKAKQEKEELNKLGVSLTIPNAYRLAEANESFVWFRKDQYNTIQNKDPEDGIITQQSQDILNILVFKVPYSKDDISAEEFYTLQDSIMKIYTKGNRDPQERYIKPSGSNDSIKILVSDHIQTERNPILKDLYDFTKLKDNENQAVYEAQGYWSMTLSQLGGPFTAKLILDKKSKTLYVADGIMFAPLNQGKSKKRDYITMMESLFTTFSINK